MKAQLRRLFEHLAWADRRLLDSLHSSPAAPAPAALRLLSHLLAAERVWLLRLRGEDSATQPIWPELGLGEMDALAAANAAGYDHLLTELSDAGLAAEVAYTNSQGTPFRTARADILTHVALHGAYHRGQIAAVLRASGAEPANTDFITWAREAR